MNLRQIVLVAILSGLTSWQILAHVPDSLQRKLASLPAEEVLIFANRMAEKDGQSARFAYYLAAEKAHLENNLSLSYACLRDMGIFYENVNQLDSAHAFYQKAYEFAERHRMSEAQRNALNDLAIISRKRTHYDAAEKYLREGLRLAESAHDLEIIEYCWHGLGYLYEHVSAFDAAAAYYLKSLDVARKRNNTPGIIITLTNLAGMRAAISRRDSALLHAHEAIQLALLLRDTEHIAHCYFTLATVYRQFAEQDSAIMYFEKASHWAKMHKDWLLFADATLHLGELAEKRGAYFAAQTCYESILNQHFSELPPQHRADVLFRLGKLFSRKDEKQKALNCLKKAYAIAESHRVVDLQIKIARLLFELFNAENEVPAALFYLSRAETLNDSLTQVIREQAATALAFRYGLVKKEGELHETAIRQGRIRLLTVSLIGLVLVLGLGYTVQLRRRIHGQLRQKNEEIRAQNARLEESNRFLQQFTYAVAHDLKEPLRSISSFLTLLGRRFPAKFDAKGNEYMQFVRQGVARMSNLITDLLNFSQISSQQPDHEPTDVRQVLDLAVEKLREEITSKNGTIELPATAPRVAMKAEHLEHLMRNLIHNALKFNHDERPSVKIAAQRAQAHVLISVEDNGIGIDIEHGKKIYELFHQLHKNKPYGGTGVGLTVCRNIVEKYNGEIWFERARTQDRGTTFWVKLPAC